MGGPVPVRVPVPVPVLHSVGSSPPGPLRSFWFWWRATWLGRPPGPVARPRSGPGPSLSPCPAQFRPQPPPGRFVVCIMSRIKLINKQLYMVCFNGAAKIGPSCRDARQVCDYLWDTGRKVNNNKGLTGKPTSGDPAADSYLRSKPNLF